MLEIVQAGGWIMLPIIACSIVAAAIILERLWTLQHKRVLPKSLSRNLRLLKRTADNTCGEAAQVAAYSKAGGLCRRNVY